MNFKSRAKKEPLPEPIETREEVREGRTYKVTVLPGYSGKAAPLPEKITKVGNYSVDEEGIARPLRLTGTEDY